MEKIDFLIDYLLKESDIKDFNYLNKDKEKLYRALVNIRDAKPISEYYLEKEDEYLQERLNENEKIQDTNSLFYNKVDFSNVGIVGYSQGGVGVINAITSTEHANVYKSAVSLSPTNKTLASNLFWDYDATKVNIPIMLISGASGGDDWVLTLDQLNDIYNDINSDKVKVRRKNTKHGEVLYSGDGYVTAWFMYYLQNDQGAGKFFLGDNPEILNNNLYQDQEININN